MENSNSPYSNFVKNASSDKDTLIAQLKNRIFELEQKEKNYNNLNETHSQLQQNMSQLKEDKLLNEYESKKQITFQDKEIEHLKSEIENLNKALEDKLVINKKLFADNETLLGQLDLASTEISKLQNKQNELLNTVERLKEDKKSLEKINYDLTQNDKKQKEQIEKLFEDNKKLNMICKELDLEINTYEDDKQNLANKVEEINYELNILKGQVKSKDDNIAFIQNQCDELNNNLKNYAIENKNLKMLNENNQKEKECLNENLLNFRSKINSYMKDKADFEETILAKEREKNKYVEAITENNERLRNYENNNKELVNEKEHLLSLIDSLENDNNKLKMQIKQILGQDGEIKKLLQDKERINSIIKSNKTIIERSLNNLTYE